MQTDDKQFWKNGTIAIADAIIALLGEAQVNCEKIQLNAGDEEVGCYLDALDNDIALIGKLRQRLYYFADVAKFETEEKL